MFIFGGLRASITVSGSVATGCIVPTANQTLITLCNGMGVTSISGAGVDIYTVTGGKKLYITAISFSSDTGGNDQFGIFDNGTGGTAKFNGFSVTSQNQFISLPSPISFATKVTLASAGTKNYKYSLIGYEE